MKINNVFVEYAGNNVFKKVIMIDTVMDLFSLYNF